MRDGMKERVGAVLLLAAAVTLGGCATSTKYALEQQPATASPRINIVDMRSADQKRAEVMSMSITSCWYGVYRVGDEQTEPPRLPYLASALAAKLGPEFAGKTLRIETLEVFNNWQAVLRPSSQSTDPTGAAYGLATPTTVGGAAGNAIGVGIAAAILASACRVDSPQLAVDRNPSNFPAVIVNYDVTLDSHRAKGTVVQLDPQGADANVGGKFVSERVQRAISAAVDVIGQELQTASLKRSQK